MGLDIKGEITRHHLGGRYSRLHFCTRFLALKYCAMPDYLDEGNSIDSFNFYMNPYMKGHFEPKKMREFLYALQISGLLFPNIMLHSDCDGTYTKRGKIASDDNLLNGNSIQLLKELDILVNEGLFKTEKYQKEYEYTKQFYDLVKDEIENGSGKIIFC